MYRYILFGGFFLCLCFGTGQQILSYYTFQKISQLYQQEKYQEILDLDILEDDAVILHNLGNTSYEVYKDTLEREQLESAFEYFKKSLDYEEHEDTRYNYEYTARLLADLDNADTQEEKESQENREDIEKSEENKSEVGTDNSERSTSTQDSEGKSGEDFDVGETQAGLSKEEKEALENIKESLQQDQRRYQQYYGKYPEKNNFNDLFDTFFGNNRGSEEKNW